VPRADAQALLKILEVIAATGRLENLAEVGSLRPLEPTPYLLER